MQQTQRSQNIPVRKVVRQHQEEQQVESRTHVNTTYEYRTQGRIINPNQSRIDTNRTTNYNLNRDLNRQAAANTAVKIQIQDQVQQQRKYGYDSNLNNYQSNQSQDRSSREGRVYHYEPTSRKEFQGRSNQRGKNIASVDNTQKGKIQYRQIDN